MIVADLSSIVLPADWKMLTVWNIIALTPVVCWNNIRPRETKRGFITGPVKISFSCVLFCVNFDIFSWCSFILSTSASMLVSLINAKIILLICLSIIIYLLNEYFPRRSWMDWRASCSLPLANSQDGDSGKKRVPNKKATGKQPNTQARTYHSTKLPTMYVIQMPSANEEAVNDPNLPRIPEDAHSLT